MVDVNSSSVIAVVIQSKLLGRALGRAGKLHSPGLGSAPQFGRHLVPRKALGAKVRDSPLLFRQALVELFQKVLTGDHAAGCRLAARDMLQLLASPARYSPVVSPLLMLPSGR